MKDIVAPSEGAIYNLHDFLVGEGYDVANYVDGGRTNQTVSTFPARNAFNGTADDGDDGRWLGEIREDVSLRVMLPAGYSCDLGGYSLWRLNTGADFEAERTATQWRMYGITENGEEVLLSDCSEDVTDIMTKDAWTVVIDPKGDQHSFVGFRWVPATSSGLKRSSLGWTVGLMELELFVKNVSTPAETGVWNLRDYMVRKGYDTKNYADGGVEKTVTDTRKDSTVQCAGGYGADKAFDGVLTPTDDAYRWLGELRNGTFLTLMLPTGYSCGIDSYRLWRQSMRVNTVRDDVPERAPTAWTFCGITEEGETVELSAIETNRLQNVDFMSVDVEGSSDRRFIGFTFKPTDSFALTYAQTNTTSVYNYNYPVCLMEFEVLVKDISAPEERSEPVYNLRDYAFGDGLELKVSGGEAGTHYPEGFGPANAADGKCTVSDTSARWLGSIQDGAYLDYRLPNGFTCEIDSYTLWRLCANDSVSLQRAPTQWTLYGITPSGREVVVSTTGDTANTGLSLSDSLTIDVSSAAKGRRFAGFKWVPTASNRQGTGDTWTVGLMEFEVLVKNVASTRPGFLLVVR